MFNLLRLVKPRPDKIRQFAERQRGQELTYQAVGATATTPPPGYVVDHTRVCLGQGEDTFAAARGAIAGCQQFDLGWLTARPPATIREGEVVVLLAHLLGLWWLNACRIVYVIDQSTPLPRFGFAYGTLPDHVETGEERFLVEMDAAGQVWYDILAFSRATKLTTRLGYPYVRRMQKRFGRDSAARMQRAAIAPSQAADTDSARVVIGTELG